MILDRGICSVFKLSNVAEPGETPEESLTLKYQSWFGELNFETAPVNPTGMQDDVKVDARIRVHQHRAITGGDVVVFSALPMPPADTRRYNVIRAYHGLDDQNGQPISDLSLQEVESRYENGSIVV